MDSAADSLLALSNTAAALADASDHEEDDRSSSLSELEEEEAENFESDPPEIRAGTDVDSEAETERLEESPDKIPHRKPFGISPSKLAQSVNVDERPEIESLTDSVISSPISSREASPDIEGLSDGVGQDEEVIDAQFERKSSMKRKREEDEEEQDDMDRSRRRRTGSLASDEKSEQESDGEDEQSQRSREGTIEPEAELDGAEEDVEEEDDDQAELGTADAREESKGKTLTRTNRPQRRKGKDDAPLDDENEIEEEPDAGEETDDVDADDAEAAAKSEEERAKRMAAMDTLTALERHFATLRDRLYDERIAALNQELVQLAEAKPSHPELLRQLEAVRKYRDDKFEVEQKLLVYKTGALKNKSVAERSQIHSAYFQTVRDIREKHLERASELFYRIQRDRFRSDSALPMYSIPFPKKRSRQIKQQTSYNKEVSILSGIAKYVGFPAAPELSQSRSKELDEDMQKMGISTSHLRNVRPPQKQTTPNNFNPTISGPAAEEQFLEQTPWANPQHPIHRLGLSRQNSERSAINDSFLTPAHQQRPPDHPQPENSASTIVEQPSAPASSVLNTPHDLMSSQTANDHKTGQSQNYRLQSASPLETRRNNLSAMQGDLNRSASQPRDFPRAAGSSPLNSKLGLANSPPRAASAVPGKGVRQSENPPFADSKDTAITAGSGHTNAGRFSLI